MYVRLIDSCITQLKAQGPSRTCNESKEEEEKKFQGLGMRVASVELGLERDLPGHHDLHTHLQERAREFCIDNLLVRIHCIIVMIRWTGLAPWEFESPFPGSITSTFIESETPLLTPSTHWFAPDCCECVPRS